MGNMLMKCGADEWDWGEQHRHVYCLRRAQRLVHQELEQAVRLGSAVKVQQRGGLVV